MAVAHEEVVVAFILNKETCSILTWLFMALYCLLWMILQFLWPFMLA